MCEKHELLSKKADEGTGDFVASFPSFFSDMRGLPKVYGKCVL